MSSAPDMSRQLHPFLENLAGYESDARMLAALAAQARQVSPEVLVRVEEISDDIRSDIDRHAKLVQGLKKPSPDDLAQATEVGEALRLLLLEVTETGTRLYSLQSA